MTSFTTGAQEELDHEMQECKEEEMTNQELRQELEEAQNDLTAWEDWYYENHLPLLQPRDSTDPFAETNELMESFNQPDSSETVAAKKALPQPAPLISSCSSVLCFVLSTLASYLFALLCAQGF